MEEFEMLKKLFNDKEKENKKLKDELIECRVPKNNQSNLSYSNNVQPDSDRSYIQSKNNFTNNKNEANSSQFSNKYSTNDCNKDEFIFSPSNKITESNSNNPNNNINTSKLLNIIDNERYLERDKPTKINEISAIFPNENYFTMANERVNEIRRADKPDQLILTKENTDQIDFQIKLKLKEEEIIQLKDLYENEIKIKADLYNSNISHLTKIHQEEVKKLRIDCENKISEVIKKNEDDKFQLQKKIICLETEFQKKGNSQTDYIDYNNTLYKENEELRTKLANEMLILKQQRDELYNKYLKYKECYGKLKNENEKLRKESFARETQLIKKIENYKSILNNHEEIKQNLDKTSSEIICLKNQVSQYTTNLHTVENEKYTLDKTTKNNDLSTSEKIKSMENYLFKMTKENDELRQKIDYFVTNTGLIPNNNIINNYINKSNEERFAANACPTANNYHSSRLTTSQLNNENKHSKRELTPDANAKRFIKSKPQLSPDGTMAKTKNYDISNNKTSLKPLKKQKSSGKLKSVNQNNNNNNLKISTLKVSDKKPKHK